LNKRLLLFPLFFWFCLFFPNSSVYAQVSAGGIPPSTILSLPEDRNVATIAGPDLQVIQQEDRDNPLPYRYGVNLPVDYTPENSGSWTNLADGSRLWRLTVRIDGALGLSACFDKFYIPAGGKLFLYNLRKSMVIGAFTFANNSKRGFFATELLAGDQLTLEYLQPSGSSKDLQLHLSEIVFAYRGVSFPENQKSVEGSAGACEVNINCPEGKNWQLQKKGIVRISIKKGASSFWCSGSLLNNVKMDHTPYILTADHCGITATPDQLLQWVFYFDFEAPDCTNPLTPPTPKSLTGAVFIAESGNGALTGSDFYLVELTAPIPSSYQVYYNGWDNRNIASHAGVGIHHPEGDIKKISTYSRYLETSIYGSNPSLSFWKVFWDQTVTGHGVTEPGSSGSAIFDTNGRIVGTLTGGESACDSASLNLADYYGKFYWSWDLNGTDSTRRLKDWLDPDSTGVHYIDGLLLSVNEKAGKQTIRIYPNPFHETINVEWPGTGHALCRVEIYDFLGARVRNEDLSIGANSTASLQFPDLAPGMYMLKVFSGDEVFCVKMIKQ